MTRETSARLQWLVASSIALAGCGGDRDEAAMLASARESLARHDQNAAVIQLKNALERNRASLEARWLLGKALLERGDAAGAEVELRRAAAAGAPRQDVTPLLARSLLQQGEYRKVITEFSGQNQAADAQQLRLEILMAVAQAQFGFGSSARASDAVKQALSIDPQHGPARLMEARLKAQAGEAEAALRIVDAVLARQPDDADAHRLQGDLLFAAKGDVAGAIAAYGRSLKTRDAPETRGALVAMYLRQANLSAASQQLDALKKLRPQHPETLYLAARVAFDRADYAGARQLMQNLVSVAAPDSKALWLAGAVEMQLGSLQQAQALLGRAVQQSPNFADARRMLAEALLRDRQPARALATLSPLLQPPSKPTAMVLALAAQAHVLNGDTAAAQSLFARAVKLKPNDKRLEAALAVVQMTGNGADKALGRLQALAATDSGTAVDLAVVDAQMRRLDMPAALRAIDALERKQPASPVAAELRGRVQLLLGKADEARHSFDASLAKDAGYIPALIDLAQLDTRQGRLDTTIARFQAQVKRQPDQAPLLMAFATVLDRAGGNADEVARLHERAVAADPTNPQMRSAQIDFLLARRRQDAALAAARVATVALPGNVLVLDRLARAQLACGERAQALSSFTKVIAASPDTALGYLGRAQAHVAEQDLEAAARDVRAALDREPDSLDAQRLSVTLALRLQRPEEALALARAWQKRRPDEALGDMTEGEIQLARRHWPAAEAAFRRALDKPDAGHAAARLHTTLLSAGRSGEAARFAESWRLSHAKDGQFLSYLGDAALAQGDYATAHSRYLQAAQLDPANPWPLNNIAWILLKQNKPGAVDYAQRAVDALPGEPALMDTLATVLSNERQHARAIDMEKQVVAKAPQVPAYRLNLSRIYISAGDRAMAKAELDRLSALSPAFAAGEEPQRLLKTLNGS